MSLWYYTSQGLSFHKDWPWETEWYVACIVATVADNEQIGLQWYQNTNTKCTGRYFSIVVRYHYLVWLCRMTIDSFYSSWRKCSNIVVGISKAVSAGSECRGNFLQCVTQNVWWGDRQWLSGFTPTQKSGFVLSQWLILHLSPNPICSVWSLPHNQMKTQQVLSDSKWGLWKRRILL